MKYLPSALLTACFIRSMITGFTLTDVGVIAVLATFTFMQEYYKQSDEFKKLQSKVETELKALDDKLTANAKVLDENKLAVTTMKFNLQKKAM